MTNKISSIEQYAEALTTVFTTLRERGLISLPYPTTPTPWNDRAFQPTFEAEGPAHVVPDWRFSCYPGFTRQGTGTQFADLTIGVHVRNATMHGPYERTTVRDPDQIPAVLQKLMEFRDNALKACRHRNHSHVARLGRCYNSYKCNDCGVTFNIDSGD